MVFPIQPGRLFGLAPPSIIDVSSLLASTYTYSTPHPPPPPHETIWLPQSPLWIEIPALVSTNPEDLAAPEAETAPVETALVDAASETGRVLEAASESEAALEVGTAAETEPAAGEIETALEALRTECAAPADMS